MTLPTYSWQCGQFSFEQNIPLVMGVLNVTPDSFSDGGRYSDPFDALVHANEMIEQGAQIIEVGGESTHPGSKEVSPQEELKRVLTVVKALAQEGICVAVDTRHAEVAQMCVYAGASIINDICGFEDPAMLAVAKKSSIGCVVMHMQGSPQNMQENPHYKDVVEETSAYLLEQAKMLEREGVSRERICIDPGPGFGKTSEHNKALLRNTERFASLGTPPYLLMGAWSRKRFIGELSEVEKPRDRVAGSLAAALFSAARGAGVLRVHDVGPTVEALKVWFALDE